LGLQMLCETDSNGCLSNSRRTYKYKECIIFQFV
jgi:hypothetical protein